MTAKKTPVKAAPTPDAKPTVTKMADIMPADPGKTLPPPPAPTPDIAPAPPVETNGGNPMIVDTTKDSQAPAEPTFNERFIALQDKYIAEHVANGNPDAVKEFTEAWRKENLEGYTPSTEIPTDES